MTRLRTRGALLAVACVAAATLLAGCGSDGEEQVAATDSASTSGPTDATSAPSDPGTDPTDPTTDPTETSSPPTPTAPGCAEVWVAGARIPRGYQGCLEDDVLVEPDRLPCSSGQALIRYADRFYGVAGGTIYEGTTPLLDDPDYTTKVENCRA